MPRPKHILVIGLGTFGRQAAVALSEGGATIVAIDRDRDRVDSVSHQLAKAVCADGTDEEALDAVGAFDVDAAIVSVGEFFDITVLVTYLLRRRGVKEIVVQVDSQRQGEAIRAVGATEVVFPERDTANAITERFLGAFAFKRQAISRDASLIELSLPAQAVGKTLKELELRRRYSVNVVAIKTPAQEEGMADTVSVTPDADAPLVLGQVLIVVGHNHHLARFREVFPDDG